MVFTDRQERVRAPQGRRVPVAGRFGGATWQRTLAALRRRSSLVCAWTLVVLASPAFAQGGYLDPPHAEPGLSGFAAQVEFAPAEVPPAAAGTASPHGGAWFVSHPPNFALEPPWSTGVVVGTHDGALWRLTLRDHANVDVRVVWVTERLMLVEVWWGRTVSSELLVDAWRGELVHATTYAWYGALDGDGAPP